MAKQTKNNQIDWVNLLEILQFLISAVTEVIKKWNEKEVDDSKEKNDDTEKVSSESNEK